jgi:hypothetical protein
MDSRTLGRSLLLVRGDPQRGGTGLQAPGPRVHRPRMDLAPSVQQVADSVRGDCRHEPRVDPVAETPRWRKGRRPRPIECIQTAVPGARPSGDPGGLFPHELPLPDVHGHRAAVGDAVQQAFARSWKPGV